MRKLLALSVVGMAASLLPARADAHFILNALDTKMPVCWMSQDSMGGPQKLGPCAAMPGSGDAAAGKPTGIVTGLTAGEKVSIAVNATIGHPGWWRVALVEGASSTQTPTLAFRESSPDPELLTVGERVLETVLAHHAAPADFLGFARGCSTLREEQIGIYSHAVGPRLPVAVLAAVQQ